MTTFSGGTIDGSILPSQTGHDLGAASTRWDAFLQDLDASGTLTFGSGAVATLGTLTLGNLNNILFVDGVKYATIAAAVAGLGANGGTVIVRPGHRETITSTINLGTGYVGGPLQTVALFLENDVVLTCNITNGTPCFKIASGSGIWGRSNGLGDAENGAGSIIHVPATANISSVITPAFTNSTQQYYFLKNITITSINGATISGAGVDVTTVADMTEISGVQIIQFPGILMRLKATTAQVGPCCGIRIGPVWLDGATTTSRPLVIQGMGATGGVSGIEINTASITNAGPNIPLIEIDGLGFVDTVYDIMFNNLHLEQNQTPNATWIKIRDASNISFNNVETTSAVGVTGSLFSISESAVGLTHSISVRNADAKAATNIVSDTIGGKTIASSASASGTLTEYVYLANGSYRYSVSSTTAGGGQSIFGNTDTNSSVVIKGTTAASTLSSNLRFEDNQASPASWSVRKSGADLHFISPSGVPTVLADAGIIGNYKGIATVSNGVPAEYAAVDLTAQTAAVGTTTLYAVPASGAGQYRLSWNAKVTTPATTGAITSTLGALTIVYTDPDGVVQTITAPASIAAGTIATTSTGNTTATVLLGVPLLLNCKLSTNITYAMAYASNTAAEMKFNLHIKCEAM